MESGLALLTLHLEIHNFANLARPSSLDFYFAFLSLIADLGAKYFLYEVQFIFPFPSID